jgi:3-methyladenine DNA glycosylase/8-oxoguanine DNA glycosylase
VIKRELARRLVTATAQWAPFRSYATMHLWYAAVDF